jgi:arylsulfatase A-like enzyme
VSGTGKRPNILFVFADQLRACACGPYGNRRVDTANLNRLAAEGVTFENAVANCPVCTPYRASLLTGRYPLSTGLFVNDVRMHTDEVTIAHVLRDAGYQTAYIGKWHLDGPRRGGFTPPGSRRQGFDHFWAVGNCTHDYFHSLYYRDEPAPRYWDGYDAVAQTSLAIDYLQNHHGQREAGRPFCLLLSYGPPHNPYRQVPKEFLQMYPPGRVEPRPNCPEPKRDEIGGYWAHVTALDRQLGRLAETLERLDLARDTIFVYTSDHGDMLDSQRQRRKQRPWDESVRVPFVIRWPGHLPAGARLEEPFNVVDVMPTLLRLAGAAVPDTVEGVDFSARLAGREVALPRSAFLANYAPFAEYSEGPEWRGVRTARFTYVRTLEGPWLLYDNRADPYQMRDLIDEDGAAKRQAELDDELKRWLERTGDAFEPAAALLARYGIDFAGGAEVPYTSDPEPP